LNRVGRAMGGRKSVGVFTTDRALIVQSWDAWMVEATGVPESAAIGEPLARLYPDLSARGVLPRLRRAAEGLGVEVLAPALHKFLIPCAPLDRTSRFEHMRQRVTLAPLNNGESVVGVVVTIEDVTPRFDRERRLAADLDSDDESVRMRAAEALAAGRDAPSLLSVALDDPSWRVRRVAVEGMAAGGGRAVIDTLIEAVRDHHANAALLNSALTALARSGPDAVLPLLPLLTSPDTDTRVYAALALGLMDDTRAVPPLINALDDADVNVRYHAIEALGRIGDPQASAAIVEIAATRDFFLAFPALDALALIGDTSAAPRVISFLDDELLLPAAAGCLGSIGEESAVAPVAAALDRAPHFAATIATALCGIHDRLDQTVGAGAVVAALARGAITEGGAAALTAAIPTANTDELQGLAVVLSWLRFDGIDATLAELLGNETVRELVGDLIAGRGVGAAPYIETLITDDVLETRRVAAMTLGRIGAAESVSALLSLASSDSDARVVVAAVSALGAIGGRRAFPVLLDLMDHAEATVRQAVVGALNSIGHPKMEAAISGRLSDPSPRVREAAARVVGYFGYDSCLRRMVELCEDEDPLVRRSAVESLANFDQRPAWSKIYELASSDSDATVRSAAVRALGQHAGDESIDTLVAALADSNLWVRYYAARSCMRRRIQHASAIAALLESAMRDRAMPVRLAAIDALGASGVPGTLDILLTLAVNPDRDIARAALAALGGFDAGSTAAVLEGVLDGDDAGRQDAALDAIGRQGADADALVPRVGTLAQALGDWNLRRRAIDTLAYIGTAAATRELLALAENHRFRELITAAVARVAYDGGHAALLAALDDPSETIRDAAARGLARADLRDAIADRPLRGRV
jgi:HEAT repeat protein